MFRKMRRKKQELSKEESINILINEPRGVLALTGDYNYPYPIPMSHVYVDGKLYFHGAKTGHKNDAVKNNPKASYCVVTNGILNDDGWSYKFKSVIIFGEIKILNDSEEKIDKLTYLGNKFFPSHDYTVDEIKRLLDKTEVYELTIKHITGKYVEEK
ncbi:MAG: pyridoxamine 5'-phosphate oxidase family protein [Methanobrevibacter thaueri]|nr:pyridoxamine 5'-phosphate oxidase family protein [Methanobrevibacter thaueri]